MRHILILLTVLCTLTGCLSGECSLYADSTVPESLDYTDLDVSRTKAVRLHSGYTGEVVWLTEPEDIQAVTDCVVQIRAENPESSRGYYGWSYGIDLYDVENPAEDTQPFWYGGMNWGSMTSMYAYETVKGNTYGTRYEMTGITTEEIDAVCERFFLPNEHFSFSLVWGIHGISSYDSESGILIKTNDTDDLTKYTTTLHLTEEEQREVYAILSHLDMESYPDVYDPINDPASDTAVSTSPSVTLELTVINDGSMKTISCRDIADSRTGYDEAAQVFLDACTALQELLTATEEWQSLPEPGKVYH